MQSPALRAQPNETTTYAIPEPSKSGLPTTPVYSSNHLHSKLSQLLNITKLRHGIISYRLTWHIFHKSPLLFSNNCCRNGRTLLRSDNSYNRSSGFTTRGN